MEQTEERDHPVPGGTGHLQRRTAADRLQVKEAWDFLVEHAFVFEIGIVRTMKMLKTMSRLCMRSGLGMSI